VDKATLDLGLGIHGSDGFAARCKKRIWLSWGYECRRAAGWCRIDFRGI